MNAARERKCPHCGGDIDAAAPHMVDNVVLAAGRGMLMSHTEAEIFRYMAHHFNQWADRADIINSFAHTPEWTDERAVFGKHICEMRWKLQKYGITLHGWRGPSGRYFIMRNMIPAEIAAKRFFPKGPHIPPHPVPKKYKRTRKNLLVWENEL